VPGAQHLARGRNGRFVEAVVEQLEPEELGRVGLEVATGFPEPPPGSARVQPDQAEAEQEAVRLVGVASEAELQQPDLAGREDGPGVGTV
jgi:hypothetical protein